MSERLIRVLSPPPPEDSEPWLWLEVNWAGIFLLASTFSARASGLVLGDSALSLVAFAARDILWALSAGSTGFTPKTLLLLLIDGDGSDGSDALESFCSTIVGRRPPLADICTADDVSGADSSPAICVPALASFADTDIRLGFETIERLRKILAGFIPCDLLSTE